MTRSERIGPAIVFLAVAIVLIATAFFKYRRNSTRLADETIATGTVVGSEPRSAPRTIDLYAAARVQFRDTRGAMHTFIASQSEPTSHHWRGEHVTIAYDKSNPSNADLYSAFQTWAIPAAFALFGVAALYFAIVSLVSSET